MNFLAGLIYLAVRDEVIAFALLTKVMFEHNWREVYRDELIMLLNLTKKVQQWLKKEQRQLYNKFRDAGVVLEAQLSSPIMAMFANLIPVEDSLKLLDRFFLSGELSVLNVIKRAIV